MLCTMYCHRDDTKSAMLKLRRGFQANGFRKGGKAQTDFYAVQKVYALESRFLFSFYPRRRRAAEELETHKKSRSLVSFSKVH